MTANRSRRLVLSALVAAVAVGCSAGTPAGTHPTSTAAPVAGPTVAPGTPAPAFGESPGVATAGAATDMPSAEPSSGLPSRGIPSFTADQDLEAVLPASVNRVTLQKQSLRGSDLPESNELKAVLGRLGATADDVSFAVAAPATGTSGPTISATRVAGIDAQRVIAEIVASEEAKDSTLKASPATLGGKQVTVVAAPDADVSDAIYLYGAGDIAFQVEGPDQQWVEAALAALR